MRLFPLKHTGYDDKEQRDVKEVDERGGQHPSRYSGADSLHGARTGARGNGQRQDTEEKSQRGHDDRPESDPYRPEGRLDQSFAPCHPFLRELNNKDGIFCRQAEGGKKPDLEVDIIVQTPCPGKKRCAENTEGQHE